METLQNVARDSEAAGFVVIGIDEGEGDVFDDGEVGNEVEILEDEADVFSAESGLAAAGDAFDRFAGESVLSGGGFV